nr:adenine-specific methyltransferase EcoRI family protein [uncultured Brevibacterium sp.]
MGNSCWFTNIEHGRRHEPLVLMTMDDNLIYGSKRVREIAYAKYENYNAIEVPETKGIPSDYEGAMGVPISFLDKYNPEQFEILGASLFDATPMKEVAKPGDLFQQGGLAFYIREDESTLRRLYFRLIVRHRHPETKES